MSIFVNSKVPLLNVERGTLMSLMNVFEYACMYDAVIISSYSILQLLYLASRKQLTLIISCAHVKHANFQAHNFAKQSNAEHIYILYTSIYTFKLASKE